MTVTRDHFSRDIEPSEIGPGRYSVELSERWWIQAGPNGGYVAAVMLRAMAETAGPDLPPRSVTTHFTKAPAAGRAEVATEVQHRGRSTAFVTARMIQAGEVQAVSMGVFSMARSGPAFEHAEMPRVPPPGEAEELDTTQTVPVFAQYRAAAVIGGEPFSAGERAETGGWMRPREPRPVDAPMAAGMLDVWFPAPWLVFDRFVFAPTLEYTVHLNQELPLPGATGDEWYLGRFTTDLARDGHFTEDGELWTEDGRLIARSRQLALLREAG